MLGFNRQISAVRANLLSPAARVDMIKRERSTRSVDGLGIHAIQCEARAIMISQKQIGVTGLSLFLCVALAVDAYAQSETKGFAGAALSNIRAANDASRFSIGSIQSNLNNASVNLVGVQGVNQRNFLGASSSTTSSLNRRAKPFSGISQGPSVSPYLALSAPRASASDYYNVIRPQQQRQQQNRQSQLQSIQRNRQLNRMAARAPYSMRGDETQAPTGHVAVFQSLGSYQNTGGYFPPPSPPKR